MTLTDIPYSTLQKNPEGYQILLLRDQHGLGFAAIGRELGLSTARVCGQYNKIKVRQVRLYIRHIAVALGHENTAQVRKEFFTALECYQNYACACGYLEKCYFDILEKYRAGQPGMSREVLEGLPPCPVSLGEEEIARIVTMREEGKASFRAIGREFHITPEKARYIYEMVYHRKVLAYVEQMQAQAGHEAGGWNVWQRYLAGNVSEKTRYERLLAEQGKI